MRMRIALPALLALGTAAVPCAAQGGGNDVPSELVQALLTPVALRGQPDPSIAVGRLPEMVPAGLIPADARVIGGVGGSAVFTLPQPPAEAISGWRAQLERAGWRPYSNPMEASSPVGLGVCSPDRTTFLAGWALPHPQGGSELQVRVGRGEGPYFPCSARPRPMLSDVPFPSFRTPAGVEGVSSGGSSSPDERTQEWGLRTTRAPTEIAAELIAQLREAGWHVSNPRVEASVVTAWAKRTDARGKEWRALVAVLPVAVGELSSVVRVIGTSIEPLYRSHDEDVAPVARATGPAVPGELVRALLVRPSGRGYEIRPTLVAGRLPEELAGTPLPPGARVVGGVVDPDQPEGVVFVPGEPLTLDGYAQVLRRAGWRPQRSWVLVPRNGLDERPEFCDTNGRMIMVDVVPVRDGGSYLKLRSHGPAGFCGPAMVDPLAANPLPPLPAPEGAEMRRAGGYGGTAWEGTTSGRLETSLSPAALVAHYTRLLRQAGWTVAAPAADDATATTTIEIRDARGNPWHGLVAVASLSPTERDVMVRVVRPQTQ